MSESADLQIISSDLSIKKIRRKIQSSLESFLRYIFFWESDDKQIGKFIRVLHQYFIMAIAVSYFIIHTLLPSYWLLLLIWCLICIIWIFHISLGGCVLTRIEQKLTGEKITIIDPLLELFHIPVNKETTMGITLLTSSTCFIFITFELMARTLLNIRDWIPPRLMSSILI
jgi:hypothetical protein